HKERASHGPPLRPKPPPVDRGRPAAGPPGNVLPAGHRRKRRRQSNGAIGLVPPHTGKGAAMPEHRTGTPEQWLAARTELLQREKDTSESIVRRRGVPDAPSSPTTWTAFCPTSKPTTCPWSPRR